MDLINQTALTAALTVSTLPGEHRDVRHGLLVAKATFEVGASGGVELVDADPLALLEEDRASDLGVLPADTQIGSGDDLEVMLLGAAYAPRGRAVPEVRVDLHVGDRAFALDVSGDRVWAGRGRDAEPTAPLPFERMPLTWERTFGGTSDVWLDAHALIEIPDPRNPLGRGFDPEPAARGLARHLGVPAGYPRWDEPRPLPNLEHPAHRLRRYDDPGLPYCWAPRPLPLVGAPDAPPPPPPTETLAAAAGEPPRGVLRCLPELRLPRAPLGAPVWARGVREGRDWGFALPPLRVLADYVAGPRRGERELVPRRLVLMPDQSRFYLVYQMDFRMRVGEADERSFRLRLA